MVSKNDITGDKIKSKSNSEKYRDNYDRIFRKSKLQEKTMKLPAGVYIIGDPCYYIKSSVWSDFIKKHDYFYNSGEYIFEEDGIPFSVIQTAYGDGEYFDNSEKRYPVDAGVIAAIPVNFPLVIDKDKLQDQITLYNSIHLYHFNEDFECSYNNGRIKFGFVEINTAVYEDDDYSDDKYEDDYVYSHPLDYT